MPPNWRTSDHGTGGRLEKMMRTVLRVLSVAAIAILAGAPAMGAAAQSPEGNWVTGPKDVRHEFKLCGKDGQELCAWLTYVLDQNPRVQRYVGKQVLDRARRIGPQAWKGSLVFSGYRMNGTMTLIRPDEMEIEGCVALIICGKFSMYRE